MEHFVDPTAALSGVSLFALMRAFSSGAVALTGVEAISNTLMAIVTIVGGYFLGIFRAGPGAAAHTGREPDDPGPCRLGDGALYLTLQAATATILVLAAHTAYNAFPAVA